MVTRRSLSAGVNTPEGVDPDVARAFIKQESRLADVPKNEPVELSVLASDHDQPSNSPSGSPIAQRPREVRKKLLPVGLIPVTVRLRPQIAGGLKQASLERQLQGEEVYTQQDLVEQVLEPWLRSQGYLTD